MHNFQLTVARSARQLRSETDRTGGGMPVHKWNASGYGPALGGRLIRVHAQRGRRTSRRRPYQPKTVPILSPPFTQNSRVAERV